MEDNNGLKKKNFLKERPTNKYTILMLLQTYTTTGELDASSSSSSPSSRGSSRTNLASHRPHGRSTRRAAMRANPFWGTNFTREEDRRKNNRHPRAPSSLCLGRNKKLNSLRTFRVKSEANDDENNAKIEEQDVTRDDDEEGEIDFDSPVVKFPRRNEKDPYKRLGLTSDSSFEEVQEARNFLVKEYMRDVDGCEQIDLAMDAILKEKLNTRKKAKGLKRKNLRQKKEEEDYTPPFVQRVKNQFEKPDKTTLMRRAVLFFGISIWSIVTPASQGPAFQLACAFAACVFFLNEKRGGQKNKALGKSFLHTLASMLVGWLIGSIVPVYIPLFPESFSPELILSLFSFLTLFITCTFLK